MLTNLEIIKGLKQITLQRLLLTCAPISELPSTLSTMVATQVVKTESCQKASRFYTPSSLSTIDIRILDPDLNLEIQIRIHSEYPS